MIVEFALAFPVLMVFVIGMIEFTRMHNLRHAADNAAYEAARHVIVPGASVADATRQAIDLLNRAGVAQGTVVVSPSPILETTQRVTVQVDVPLRGNSWLPPALTADRMISRQTTLMTERVPAIQARAIPEPPPPPAKPPKPKTPKKPKPPQKPKPPGTGAGGDGGAPGGGKPKPSPPKPPSPPTPPPPPKPPAPRI